jgi:hypothetical protein
MLPDGKLDLQLGIDRKQLVQVRRKDELAKSSIGIDTQSPAHQRRGARRKACRVLDPGEQRSHILEELAALLGKADSAGGAMKQTHAYPLL